MKYHILVNAGSGDQYLLELKKSLPSKDLDILENELKTVSGHNWENVIRNVLRTKSYFVNVWDFDSHKCPIQISSIG